MSVTIRKGERQDIPSVYKLVKELAEFEKAPHEVVNTVDQMKEDGFGDRRFFEFYVAESKGDIVGLALYFFSYSTWKGKSLYVDDLIVNESHRGKGIGTLLFNKIFEIAESESCGKVHWQVLDWNEPAIKYYEKLGAAFDGEWLNCHLTLEQVKEINQRIEEAS